MNQKLPKITIITPTYNQGQYIEQTIESVLEQGYPNLEYMIFDGGSEDNTIEIIKKYGKHLSFWVSEPDKGQSDAINKGLQQATGDVVNWLNSDDYYEPNCLQTVAECFLDEQVNVVCGRSNLFKEDGKIVQESAGTDVYPNNLAKTIGWARIDQPETFFRKTAIDKMGLLEPSFHYVMDKEWWIRYLLLFGLDNIREVEGKLVNFRLHEASKTMSQQDLFSIETISIYYNIAQLLGEDKIAAILKEKHQVKETLRLNVATDLLIKNKRTLVEALHYQLLYQADYYYSINQRDIAKKLISAIDKNQLQRVDQKHFSKVKFRNQFLPIWFKNMS